MKSIFNSRAWFFGLLFILPGLVLAQQTFTTTHLLNRISQYLINPIIYILLSAAFVVFIWGLVQFVADLSSEEARNTGGKHMLWGLIGMAIMVSVRGIVAFIQNTITQFGS